MFIWDIPHVTMGKTMTTAVLDDRGRIVLPRDVADELGVSKRDVVVFERRGRDIVIAKAPSKGEGLEAVMDWNPERTGKVEAVSPKAMKEIWKT
jgi:bifunctional DNA-binding transcriptional regulator/antitoxin component of YhaV-PrlF toxin-antitoxin module